MKSKTGDFYEGLDQLKEEEEFENEELDEEKIKKQYMEREKLQRDLNQENFNHLKTRVAYILSRFPEARDSDVILQLKYWEKFEDYKPGSSISPEELMKFERLTSLARARAKIQNEFRLYQASPEVKRNRRRRKEEYTEYMVLDQVTSYPSITVFCDESGKTQDYLLIGGIWILGSETREKINKYLDEWKSNHPRKDIRELREFHLKDMKRSHRDIYVNFVQECIHRFGGSIGFKAIATPRPGSRVKDTEMVFHLYSEYVIKGFSHEIKSGRVEAPCRIKVFKDKEKNDVVELIKINDALYVKFHQQYDMQGTKVWFDEVSSLESHDDYCLQIADLFTGAVARILNNNNSKKNDRDEFAHELLSLLGIENPSRETLRNDPSKSDFVVIEVFDS